MAQSLCGWAVSRFWGSWYGDVSTHFRRNMMSCSDVREEEPREAIPCVPAVHVSAIDVRGFEDFAIDFGDPMMFPRGLRGPLSIASFSNGLYDPE